MKDPKTPSKTPTKAPAEPTPAPDLDFEAQLEALFAEIEAREPGLVVRAPKPGQSANNAGPEAAAPPGAGTEGPGKSLAPPVPEPVTPTEAPGSAAPVPSGSDTSVPVSSNPAPKPPSAAQTAVDDLIEQQLAELLAEAQSAMSASKPSLAKAAANPAIHAVPELAASAVAEGTGSPAPVPAPGPSTPLTTADIDALLQAEQQPSPHAGPENVVLAAVEGPDSAPTEPIAAASESPTTTLDDAAALAIAEQALAAAPGNASHAGSEAAAPAAAKGPDDEPDPAAASATPQATLTEDDLAAQLQALLDSAKPKLPPAFADPAPAPHAGPEAAAPPGAATEGPGPAAPSGSGTSVPVSPISPTPDASSSHVESIADIDRLLAENAENAVAGAFDTSATAAHTPPSHAGPETAAPAPPEGPGDPTSASPPVAPASQAVADPREDTEPLAGGFEAPEDVLASKPTDAAELSPHAGPESSVPTDAQGPGASARRRPRRSLTPANLTYHVLATLNSPVRRLTPEMRSIVGYVALITVFNGTCLLGYGLVAGDSHSAAPRTSHVATAEASSHGASSSDHGDSKSSKPAKPKSSKPSKAKPKSDDHGGGH